MGPPRSEAFPPAFNPFEAPLSDPRPSSPTEPEPRWVELRRSGLAAEARLRLVSWMHWAFATWSAALLLPFAAGIAATYWKRNRDTLVDIEAGEALTAFAISLVTATILNCFAGALMRRPGGGKIITEIPLAVSASFILVWGMLRASSPGDYAMIIILSIFLGLTWLTVGLLPWSRLALHRSATYQAAMLQTPEIRPRYGTVAQVGLGLLAVITFLILALGFWESWMAFAQNLSNG